MNVQKRLELRDEWFREFRPGFLPLSPHVSYPKRARVVYEKHLSSLSNPPELLFTGFCRNPASIQPWEQLAACRSLEVSTGQARQYNVMLRYPSIPQAMLQELLQESINPDMLKTRRSMQGCRIVTCVLQTCTVVITAGGGRGHLLLATTIPNDRSKPHDSTAFACMSCTILELQLQPVCPQNAASPLQPAWSEPAGTSEEDTEPNSNPTQLLAVRHSLGISIYKLQTPGQKPGRSCCVLEAALYIPAAMEVVAMHWSSFVPGQLLYACRDLRTYAVHLGSAGNSVKASSCSVAAESARTKQMSGPSSQTRSETETQLFSQPRLAVVPEFMARSSPEDGDVPAADFVKKHTQGNTTNPQPHGTAEDTQDHQHKWRQSAHDPEQIVSIAVVGHPHRVVLSTGSSIYVAEVMMVPDAPPVAWTLFSNTEQIFGPISSLATLPWYNATCSRLGDLLRHVFFVGCKEALLAFHVASPAAPMLWTSMPPNVKQGCILRTDAWQHLFSFPADSDRAALGEAAVATAPPSAAPGDPAPDTKLRETHAGEPGTATLPSPQPFSQAHSEAMAHSLECAETDDPVCGGRAKVQKRKGDDVKPTGVVALGCVVGMCANDGHMFVCPFVVTPALRGLLLRSGGTASGEGGSQHAAAGGCESEPGIAALKNVEKITDGKKRRDTQDGNILSGVGAAELRRDAIGSNIQAVYVPAHGLHISDRLQPAPVIQDSGTVASAAVNYGGACHNSANFNDGLQGDDQQYSARKCLKRSHSCAHSSAQPPPGQHRNDDDDDANRAAVVGTNRIGASDTDAHCESQKPVWAPWVFAESAAAQWLGTPQVFGYPIKSHMNAAPQLRAEIAAAEAVCTQATARMASLHAIAAAHRADLSDSTGDKDAENSGPVGPEVNFEDVILPITLKEPGLKQRVREKTLASPKAKADDRNAAFAMDIIRMHDECFDNIGCVVRWDDGDESQVHAAHACTQQDLIAGGLRVEELIASGDGRVFYNKLQERCRKLTCMRSSCSGSLVVQEFGWCQQPAGTLSQALPESLVWKLPGSRMQDCAQAVRASQPAEAIAGMPMAVVEGVKQQRTDAEHRVRPVRQLFDGFDTFEAWNTKCVTCSLQLQDFLRCWNGSTAASQVQSWSATDAPDPLLHSSTFKISDFWTWKVTKPSSTVQALGSSDAAGRLHDDKPPNVAAFLWPFSDPRLPVLAEPDTDAGLPETCTTGGTHAASSPWGRLVSDALSELLPRVKSATTVAELWASVLHVLALQCGDPQVISQQAQVQDPSRSRYKKKEKRIAEETRAALPKCCVALCNHSIGDTPFCCREAESSTVWGRRIDGDIAQVSSAATRALCSGTTESAGNERGGGEDNSSIALLHTPDVCCEIPGRLITGYKTMYAAATKQGVTDLSAKLENTRILLRLHLLRPDSTRPAGTDADCTTAAGDVNSVLGVRLGARDILGLVIKELKALGVGTKLQLLRVQNPCWYILPSATPAGTVRRQMVPLDALGTNSGSVDGFVHLHGWVVLPVGQSANKAVSRKARHELRVEQSALPIVSEDVQERMAEVLKEWQ